MKNKKGFTLIELLAVIIILGVIMLIAIPSVTQQITNSRKKTYAETARSISNGAKTIVNSGELPVYKPRTTYYLPIEMINTENGKRSPFGEFTEAYVVVAIQTDGYDYYWTSVDTSKTGILLTHYDNLESSSVKSNIEEISTDISICGNDNIIVFNEDGTIKEEKQSNDCINPKSTYAGTTNAVVSTMFFDFDSSTGTITRVHDVVNFELLDANRCATYIHDLGWDEDLSIIKDYCENDLQYDVMGEEDYLVDMRNQGIINLSIEHYPTNLVIPEEINGVAVTAIGENIFGWNAPQIESIKLPKSLKRLESNSLSRLGLKSIVIPNGVTYIGSGALSNNFFSKITIPSTVTEIGNGALYDCPILYEVINKTSTAFNWTSIFGYYGNTQEFVTGTYQYNMDEYTFYNSHRYFYDPYHIKIYVTSDDTVNINIDSMFDIGPHKFELKNTNGYKVYSYSLSSNSYLETSPGPMNRISGYCGAYLTNYYITDNSGNVLYQGFYKYYQENAAC